MVVTERTKYLEEIKSLFSNSSKFIQLRIDEGKWINYIINLQNKLKDSFKVPKNEEKISEKDLIVLAQLELHLAFYMVILKYIEQSLTTLRNLFYQQ